MEQQPQPQDNHRPSVPFLTERVLHLFRRAPILDPLAGIDLDSLDPQERIQALEQAFAQLDQHFFPQHERSTVPRILPRLLPQTRQRLKEDMYKVWDWYIEAKPWESEELYRNLKVREFTKIFLGRRIQRNIEERRALGIHDRLKFTDPNILENEIEQTKRLEMIHVLGFFIYDLFSALPVGAAVAKPDPETIAFAAITIASNIVINVYPVMLQRYNRLRFTRRRNQALSEE